MQRWLVELLETRLPTFRVGMEFPFRPFAEFELRAADVAAISKASFDATDLDDNLQGAPDLVIRLKSPSHTERSLQEFAAICLAKGAREFWVVDLQNQSVSVVGRRGVVVVYALGSSIPLDAFGASDLSVD